MNAQYDVSGALKTKCFEPYLLGNFNWMDCISDVTNPKKIKRYCA